MILYFCVVLVLAFLILFYALSPSRQIENSLPPKRPAKKCRTVENVYSAINNGLVEGQLPASDEDNGTKGAG